MSLDELIDRLRECPADAVPPYGFGEPHSYRGYYECLSFEPTEGVSFGEMLANAWKAYGTDYQGYKGGWFTMFGRTECYFASYGSTGGAITSALIDYMEMCSPEVLGERKGDPQ